MSQPRHKVTDRVQVWIAQRNGIEEGDTGTVIAVRKGPMKDVWYVDVILDTGHRMGHYHEGTFIPEQTKA